LLRVLKKIEEIIQNGLFLQSEREPGGSFFVVSFHQPTAVE